VPHPTWLAYILAVIMVAVSLYCVARLIAARRWNRQNNLDVNVSHVLMGLAMAGMLVPRANKIPVGLWEVVFVAVALWFAAKGVRFLVQRGTANLDRRDAHHLSHLLIHMVMACAMLYLYLLAGPMTNAGNAVMAMAPATGARANSAGLPLLFLVILFASAVWQLDGLSRFSPARVGLVMSGGPGPQAEIANADDSATVEHREEAWLAPRLEMSCHIAMCITMGYMLVLSL
jgi:Domain of unknown function (DUF5134)